MQALSVWASPSEHACLISQLKLELGSYGGEKRRSLRTSCRLRRRLRCVSGYCGSRGFRSGVGSVVGRNRCELGSVGAAFALTLASEEQVVTDDFPDDGDESNVQKSVNVDGEKGQHGSDERVDVRALAYRLHSVKSVDDVEGILSGKLSKLPLQVYSTIMKCFGKEKRVDPAMALFEWLKRKSREADSPIQLNLFIYNNLLGTLKQSENFEVVEDIVKDMVTESVEPNVVTYNTLMSIYIEQGREAKALHIFEEMPTKGITPSPASYSTAIYAYRKMEDGFGAISFFVDIRNKYQNGEIRKEGDGQDWDHEFAKLEDFITRVCYQVMRRWLVNKENLSIEVLRLLKDMDKAGLKPSQSENERLIWACTREEHYLVVKELYARIRETDSSEISLSVCNHVIWLMGKAKKWWAALEVYEDLLDKGPKPNNMSYELIVSHFNILLDAARKKGIWKWGVRLLNKMEEKGLNPGSREWNSVLVACSKASETAAAIEIFKRMVENGEKPTIISYGALLSALEKGKLYEEALRVWKHMLKVGVEPNLYAYTIMASVHAAQEKFDIVDSIIREMVTVGVDPTVVTFNAIISSCARNNLGSVAYEWFERMKAQNVTPNEVSYEMLIEALGNDGKPRLAYESYLRAQNEGLELSAKAHDAVVRCSEMHGGTVDVSGLGPRPLERKKRVQVEVRKKLSEFCKIADVPRRSKPFERSEIYTTQSQESKNTTS